jgi:hypothetical protein
MENITSTNSQTSTTCDSSYNTVTYSIKDNKFKELVSEYKNSGMIDDNVLMVLDKLGEQKTDILGEKFDTLTMCVKKKCPDGNVATNFGKLIDPSQNIYGCLYMPDITSSNGQTSSTCKSGKPMSLGIPGLPEICVSSPQIYFPKFQ